MPHDIFPSTVKALINSLTGAMCERMSKIFQFTSFLHRDVSYYVNEAGLPADGFKADLCEALSGCIGTGNGSGETPNPNMPAPQNLQASDEGFADKIHIFWDPVEAPEGIDAVTSYKLYRGTTTSFSSAALIATITAPTVEYDDLVDGDLVAGTQYYYWVRATNGTDTSALSNRDGGMAASEGDIGVLDAISDLRTTYGFGYGMIALVWTAPEGATHYDIYRATEDDFAEAELIYENIEPAIADRLLHPDSDPEFWDNDDGNLVLYDTPMSGGVTPAPMPDVDFYYFVVARKSSPPAVSPESNSSLGRINPPDIYNGTSVTLLWGDADEYTVEAGITKMWVTLFGSGGDGAGGNAVYGGGGAGGPGIVQEAFDVAEGDVITIVHTPDQGSGVSTAAMTNGADGALTELKINSVTKLTANAGKGGEFNAAGGGLGGDGETGTGDVAPTIYDGYPGLPASGANGGRSGYYFSGRRMPKVTYSGGGAYNGNGVVGSGASRFATEASLAIGGAGTSGKAYLHFGT